MGVRPRRPLDQKQVNNSLHDRDMMTDRRIGTIDVAPAASKASDVVIRAADLAGSQAKSLGSMRASSPKTGTRPVIAVLKQCCVSFKLNA